MFACSRVPHCMSVDLIAVLDKRILVPGIFVYLTVESYLEWRRVLFYS